jgi:riboflavin synthase
MFTGIVQTTGRVAALEAGQGDAGDLRLEIGLEEALAETLDTGASVAVNGVCLTVVEYTENGFAADVSRETLDCTTLGALDIGDRVNLETAVTPATALGGHLVSGHVDGVGSVISRDDDARSVRLRIRAPDDLARYIAPKGSITVDGVSLTVNAVSEAEFEVNIVPHTLELTILRAYRPGYRVNLEVDVVARYLERLLQYPPRPIS